MVVEIGRIAAIFRYPVKSMRGEALESAELGWRGIEGDRRFALRRLGVAGGFPWLTAGRFPLLMQYAPTRRAEGEGPPTHARTPDGEDFELRSRELAADIARRCGHPVEMMEMKHGVFDEADISVIAAATVEAICQRAGVAADARRFRPNILVETARHAAFEEDGWVGGTLTFGDDPSPPALGVTLKDARCVMVNLDPDGGPASPEVMKAALAANRNDAGVYGAVTAIGRLRVGQRVWQHPGGARAGAPAIRAEAVDG